jgi:hypothetical protein
MADSKASLPHVVAFTLVLATCGAAQAHMSTPMTIWSSPAITNTMILNRQINMYDQVINSNREKLSRSSSSQVVARQAIKGSTLAPEQQNPAMPAKLAAQYPVERRAEFQKTFSEVLVGYQKIETQFGIPKNDIAGAVAAFVAGNYMAYRDVDFPDQNFKPLVEQMRGIIGNAAGFAESSAAEKQETYEQLAIIGTFMALTRDGLKKQPNPQTSANMRKAAKGYLEQFLKTDADRVQITANGLVLK